MSAQLMRRARRALAPAAIGGAAIATVAAVGGVAVVSPEIVASTMHDITAPFIGDSADPASFEDFLARTVRGGRDSVVMIDFYTGTLGAHPQFVDGDFGGGDVSASPDRWAADARLVAIDIDGAGDAAVLAPAERLARPDGESGTREPVFEAADAEATPVPTSTGTQVVDVGYEYDLDGNSPAYLLNGIAVVNSLMAHLDRTSSRRAPDLPVSVDEDGTVVLRDGCDAGCETADGYARIDHVRGTTFVSYESADLPLTRPLRRHGGAAGARIADAVDPALRAIVDYGYADNDPLGDPEARGRARLAPTAQETRKFADDLSRAVRGTADSRRIGADRDPAAGITPR